MINKLRLEPQINNECEICGQRTTAEGLLCRLHWDLSDGLLKERYMAARTMLIKDVFAKEVLK